MDRLHPPPELTTANARLVAFTDEHWTLEQSLSQDPDVTRWTYYPERLSDDQARERVRAAKARARSGRSQRYAITAGDARLGMAGIAALDAEVPEVVYALLPAARGRGVATEAATCLSGWLLDHGRPVVALITVEGNVASERVAARAGFILSETFRADHRGRDVLLRRWTRIRAG